MDFVTRYQFPSSILLTVRKAGDAEKQRVPNHLYAKFFRLVKIIVNKYSNK